MKCKIGIVLDNDLISDNRVLREIQILVQNNAEVFVLCLSFKGKVYNSIEGITITRIGISKRVKDILFFLMNLIPVYELLWKIRIRDFIIKYQLNILHVHDLYMAKASKKAIDRSGINVNLLLDLHENFPFSITSYNWSKGFLRRLVSQPWRWAEKEEEYLKYANGIIVLSEEYRNNLFSRFDSLKNKLFCVLPNVPDIESFNKTVSLSQVIPFEKKAPVLFYYGVVAERRGIFDALNVFTEIIDSGFDLQFLIIGPADKKDKKRFMKKIELEKIRRKVIYIPWIEHSQLSYYLNISDICIAPFLKNPQHESGIANKIFEYMLGAKPLIVSDCLPQKNLVERSNCGLVYTNLSELKMAIIKLANDKDLRSRLGKNGLEAIKREYNMGVAKENLLALYKAVLKN